MVIGCEWDSMSEGVPYIRRLNNNHPVALYFDLRNLLGKEPSKVYYIPYIMKALHENMEHARNPQSRIHECQIIFVVDLQLAKHLVTERTKSLSKTI